MTTFVMLKRHISRIFRADLFCLHTATTTIGKVRIMPLFAAYGNIAYFKQNSSIYHISKIWLRYFEISFIFPVSPGCYFKKSFHNHGLVRELLLISRDSVTRWFQNKARVVPVKFDLHLNLSWNAGIGSFHHPLFRAPWFYL